MEQREDVFCSFICCVYPRLVQLTSSGENPLDEVSLYQLITAVELSFLTVLRAFDQATTSSIISPNLGL